MKVETVKDFQISSADTVKVTEMGNQTEIMFLEHRNTICNIKKLDSDNYINLDTGEIKQYNHIENRAENLNSVRVSLRKLRAYLNTNITNTEKCLWVTLTYKENMTDTKRLYIDFKNFTKRLRYHFQKEKNMDFEYIVAVEPQGRGAWHCHVVYIFDCLRPYISNKRLSELWGHGFVTVKKLDDVDNVGAYLTAYLGDMDIDEYKRVTGIDPGEQSSIKKIDLKLENGETVQKKYVKGARLSMYPPGVNIFRKSKGIKKPRSYLANKGEYIEKANPGRLTFSKTIRLNDVENNFNQTISYEYYNKLKPVSKND